MLLVFVIPTSYQVWLGVCSFQKSVCLPFFQMSTYPTRDLYKAFCVFAYTYESLLFVYVDMLLVLLMNGHKVIDIILLLL